MPTTPVLPTVQGEHNLANTSLLATLPQLTPEDAVALVRAARMYQEGVWTVESAPELTWILLTSAVETVAQRWRLTEVTPVERMRISQPKLEPLLLTVGDDEFVETVAAMIAPYMGATATFRDFLLEYLPEAPQQRPGEAFQVQWTPDRLRKIFVLIYNYRSLALHGGTPFPAPMCQPPRTGEDGIAERPLPQEGTMATLGGVWRSEAVPMHLHIFEYIIRKAITTWWASLVQQPTTETQ